MGSFESKLHAPGVMIVRAKGDLDGDDLEKWRDDLVKFIKENSGKGACGMLIDTCQVDSFSAETIDALFEFLTDPEEVIRDVRMRFAFIGVKPFTQRFLRETMPLDELKHIRARFFHEVAEAEALAWLQAMVSSAGDLPEAKSAPRKEEPGKAAEPAKAPAKQEAAVKPVEKSPETALTKPTPPKSGTGSLKDRIKPK